MKWKKLGLIFCPDNNADWMLSHAANPTAQYLGDNIHRIFFSTRDNKNRSCVSFVDIDLQNPKKILTNSFREVLTPEKLGTFDDSGCSIGCIVEVGGRNYLYYLGWNLGVTVPWRNSIGLAVSEENTPIFNRFGLAPIMDRNQIDPFSLSYPWVLFDKDNKWQMWYGSNLNWGEKQNDMAHVIKYAESTDGIIWDRKGIVAIDFKSDDEYAISRPCVIRDGDLYKMWYSYRGDKYRIGYAESNDGIDWTRMDEKVGITVSKDGWDSEMIEYAHVFDYNGDRYMLYNGNGYGKTGFGLAILEQD